MKNKIRYSFPGRIYELLLTDDKFLQEISKIRKVESSFPRYDQWKDENGFHISFALAGYSADDIKMHAVGRQIILRSDGMDDFTSAEVLDESDIDTRSAKTSVHKGYVSRGIARRSFNIHIYISEEFDLSAIDAKMEHGLLHIFIPNADVKEFEIGIKS